MIPDALRFLLAAEKSRIRVIQQKKQNSLYTAEKGRFGRPVGSVLLHSPLSLLGPSPLQITTSAVYLMRSLPCRLSALGAPVLISAYHNEPIILGVGRTAGRSRPTTHSKTDSNSIASQTSTAVHPPYERCQQRGNVLEHKKAEFMIASRQNFEN